MGGFVRAITRIFRKPPQVVVQQPAPVATTTSQTKAEPVAKQQTLAASGYGGSTIMTGSEGVEEEANVSKTVLGGNVKKKKTTV
ncbi:hypothetical protein [uncultured Mediterranean phage uvMED]|nr:hypothetical protein [uncultured Mediterranean phage uvMED]